MRIIKPLSEETKQKINKIKEANSKVYGIWVKKVVGKTDWERNYKHSSSNYFVSKTPEGKVIMAFVIAKPASNPDWELPSDCERLSDQEYFDIATRYKL